MVGHDSKGSVEQEWAALGAELASDARGVPDACWATPEDGWAALAAEMDSSSKTRVPTAVPSFAEFVAATDKTRVLSTNAKAETHSARCTQPMDSARDATIPSFEEFKAAQAAVQQEGDPLLAMRNRDPLSIENGWAALGAALNDAEPTINSVEDGWAALGSELEAQPPTTWAELGGEDAARRVAIRTDIARAAAPAVPAVRAQPAQHSTPAKMIMKMIRCTSCTFSFRGATGAHCPRCEAEIV